MVGKHLAKLVVASTVIQVVAYMQSFDLCFEVPGRDGGASSVLQVSCKHMAGFISLLNQEATKRVINIVSGDPGLSNLEVDLSNPKKPSVVATKLTNNISLLFRSYRFGTQGAFCKMR